MKRKYTDAYTIALRQLGIADNLVRQNVAGFYIKPFSVSRGQKFVIVCRVSTRQQARRRNLYGQAKELRKAVESKGGIVLRIYRMTCSGFYPRWLEEPATLARKHGATLLAESTDRFIRHTSYLSNCTIHKNAQATEEAL